jgi:hypothetical protein
MLGWQLLRSAAWFPIPVRLAPVLVIIIALCFSWYLSYPLMLAFAAAGGCAVIMRIINADAIEPWIFPRVIRRKNMRAWPPGSGGHPRTPARRSVIGARIPPL